MKCSEADIPGACSQMRTCVAVCRVIRTSGNASLLHSQALPRRVMSLSMCLLSKHLFVFAKNAILQLKRMETRCFVPAAPRGSSDMVPTDNSHMSLHGAVMLAICWHKRVALALRGLLVNSAHIMTLATIRHLFV